MNRYDVEALYVAVAAIGRFGYALDLAATQARAVPLAPSAEDADDIARASTVTSGPATPVVPLVRLSEL